MQQQEQSARRTLRQRSTLQSVISREIRLLSGARPAPVHTDFELVAIELPALQAGQLLIQNMYMSVDPYMQSRFGAAGSSIPAFRVGEPLEGSAVGKVVASAVAGFAPGDAVTSMYGWREYFIANPSDVRRVDGRIQPLSAHLGVLGTTGLAAWAGVNLAQAGVHDQVFVSAAAGAVGSVIGQLVKLRGCYVAGAASSGEAAAMLVSELGFDAAFDGSQAELARELGVAFPRGIDVYFDNVGGTALEVVLAAMRPEGRIVTCGGLSLFDEPVQLKRAHNRELFVSKRLTMKGFLVSDWLSLAPVFQKAVGDHLLAGRLRSSETIIEGIDRAPHAFEQLSRDQSLGKIIVKLA
jgi:NADPH-dependent curcumin reductase CurA